MTCLTTGHAPGSLICRWAMDEREDLNRTLIQLLGLDLSAVDVMDVMDVAS